MLILSNIAKLYDGTSASDDALHGGVDLWVDDGKIHDLRPHDPDLRVGNEHRLVDCSDYTITPGLVDCHGHITALGLAPSDFDAANGPAGLVMVEKVLYATLVSGGVTTMRDMGGATHLMKRLVDDGTFIGPRLKISICMLSSTGGHADFRGPDRCWEEVSKLWPPMPGRPSSVVDGPWECRKRVREIVACGADFIKICSSPGVASPGDKLEDREFTEEEVRAMCDEAEARGLRVASHAHSQSGIEIAIRNGVHDIQHISFMDQRLVDMADKAGCTVTPTSWTIAALFEKENLPEDVAVKIKQVAEVHRKAVEYSSKGGLKILAGTDAVMRGMHGRNYMELACLVEDGLSPLSAWHGMTGLGASEVGQDDTGTLQPGKRADLLVCRSDVIANPELMQAGFVEVVKDGVGYRGGIEALPQRTFESTVQHVLTETES
jgi:imidazolonepropionase-like amidohydrolase